MSEPSASPGTSFKKRHGGVYPKAPRAAVGAVVFNRARVLLVRRGQPPMRGKWAIPGGSIELGETLQQAAEREILEETGITIRAGEPIFTFDLIERDATGRVQYHYLIVDLLAEYVAGVPRAGDDASQARWVSVDEAQGLPLNAATRRLLVEHFDFSNSGEG